MLLKNPQIKRETEKAILVKFDIEVDEMLVDLEEWMPRSQIKSINSMFIEVSDWIAEQKDLLNKAQALVA